MGFLVKSFNKGLKIEESMLITKIKYKIVVLGLLLIFSSPQTLFCDQGWKEFNSNELTHVYPGWYEKIENTLKETSVTGKGPLWAQVATSIVSRKAADGESMLGFKIKL